MLFNKDEKLVHHVHRSTLRFAFKISGKNKTVSTTILRASLTVCTFLMLKKIWFRIYYVELSIFSICVTATLLKRFAGIGKVGKKIPLWIVIFKWYTFDTSKMVPFSTLTTICGKNGRQITKDLHIHEHLCSYFPFNNFMANYFSSDSSHLSNSNVIHTHERIDINTKIEMVAMHPHHQQLKKKHDESYLLNITTPRLIFTWMAKLSRRMLVRSANIYEEHAFVMRENTAQKRLNHLCSHCDDSHSLFFTPKQWIMRQIKQLIIEDASSCHHLVQRVFSLKNERQAVQAYYPVSKYQAFVSKIYFAHVSINIPFLSCSIHSLNYFHLVKYNALLFMMPKLIWKRKNGRQITKDLHIHEHLCSYFPFNNFMANYFSSDSSHLSNSNVIHTHERIDINTKIEMVAMHPHHQQLKKKHDESYLLNITTPRLIFTWMAKLSRRMLVRSANIYEEHAFVMRENTAQKRLNHLCSHCDDSHSLFFTPKQWIMRQIKQLIIEDACYIILIHNRVFRHE
ncbi:hypothetical protein EGR_04246 [Echinococcus granulosus]|uniref:Uncharacterized protein n=1 Tax=Echinococcus granulosus TaxID=6210 RepID=W6UHM0_ECHGR|nr:hypothetical protein EGR_04246 [Echinococcus granulosus]EUB61000.1 hypothetical protein EGR_04246 [Echinococcus granulosus]